MTKYILCEDADLLNKKMEISREAAEGIRSAFIQGGRLDSEIGSGPVIEYSEGVDKDERDVVRVYFRTMRQ